MKTKLSTLANSALVLSLALALSHSAVAAPQKCEYEVDPQSVQVEWTAFKTTQKVGVKGSFGEVTLLGDLKKKATWEKFLGQVEAEINLTNESQVRTGNPGRDLTIFQNFFQGFKKKPLLAGAIKEVKGDDLQGTFALNLKMNEKKLAVPFSYTRDEKGGFFAKGAIDVNDFGLAAPLAKLNKVCEQLHKGPDGVSKTWPTVEIRLLAKINKKCNP